MKNSKLLKQFLFILMLHCLGIKAMPRLIMDATQICLNMAKGELVANPYDCQTYFSCATVPAMHHCGEDLHFDAFNKTCTKPALANCAIANEVISSYTISPLNFENTTITSQETVEPIDGWSHKPRPTFMAVDVQTGQTVDPMDKYDPQHIECRHFGAYFLPHPHSCQRYFICAYGYLHLHRCGQGTFWNYKRAECQLAQANVCYNNALLMEDLTDVGKTNKLNEKTDINSNTSNTNPVTVCYVIDTTGSTLNSKATSYSTQTTESVDNVGLTLAPPRLDSSIIQCPSRNQSYLPHPDDCTKYYICIVGMPVLTSCPKGLYWDHQNSYCDAAANVNCVQK